MTSRKRVERTDEADSERRQDLLAYVWTLIYHERDVREHAELSRVMLDAARTDAYRREVEEVGKTIAEALKEEGRDQGRAEEAMYSRREVLLMLLRERFGRIPAGVKKRIENTADVEQLDRWLRAFAKARKLADVVIAPLE